jgi:hypothetical protein
MYSKRKIPFVPKQQRYCEEIGFHKLSKFWIILFGLSIIGLCVYILF